MQHSYLKIISYSITILFLVILSWTSLGSCVVVKPAVNGMETLKNIQFDSNYTISIESTGIVTIAGVDFLPSGLKTRYNGKIIYIDPIEVKNPEKADYIFITHDHMDHFSLTDIERLISPETEIIAPKRVIRKLSHIDANIHEVVPGDALQFGEISCETVPAYNLQPKFLWITPHPKKFQNVGYIISFDGFRIYHAGDTDAVPELYELTDIDVAFVPLGGDGLTMDAERSAALLNVIKPRFAVPMHFEMKKTADINRFKELLKNDIVVQRLDE